MLSSLTVPMWHYQYRALAAVAIALLCLISMSSVVLDGIYDTDAIIALQGDEHRSLRLAPYLKQAPNATGPDVGDAVTVHLVKTRRPNPAYSLFKTDLLRRYGSGRFDFRVETGKCDFKCQPKEPTGDVPCLAVAPQRDCGAKYLKCSYPQCKTMVTNDEKCKAYLHDVREYYSSRLSKKGYLPLGPRFDAWTSFQKIQQSTAFRISPSSGRKYAFNAIFSQSTSLGRKQLAKLLESHKSNSTLVTFQSMAKEWTNDVNAAHTEQLPTDTYMAVVLDSVFTLSPAGHNPECFRLFEAVEAGSIPVLVEKDMQITSYKRHPCWKALQHWHDAPVLVLDSWDDLYPTVERLMGDPAALDEMQVNLRLWYDEFMAVVVGEFEEFLLRSYSTEHQPKASLSGHGY